MQPLNESQMETQSIGIRLREMIMNDRARQRRIRIKKVEERVARINKIRRLNAPETIEERIFAR